MSSKLHPIAQYAHVPLLPLIAALLMLQPLSTDLYLASLPSLASGFNVPAATVQLTLSLFVIGFGGAQLIVGPLSDRFGRRPILLWGLALYIAGSIVCGLAQVISLLIAARFLQALGCCCAVMVGRTIVRDTYAPADSARMVARASSWLSLAPLLGPILGSYLQVTFGWRAAFVALGLFSTCLMVAALLRLPETNTHKDPRATELAGLIANYRIVLGTRNFWAYALPGALSYGAIFAFISGASILLINVLRVPTAWFGYCFAFGVSGYMFGTLLCRYLLPKFGMQRTLHLGTRILLMTGVAFLILVSTGVAHWSLVLAVMFLTMGTHGINFPVAQSGAMSPFPKQAGTAAGLASALNMIIALSVGTVVGATHNGTLYPLASIICVLGVLIFCSVHLIRPVPQVT